MKLLKALFKKKVYYLGSMKPENKEVWGFFGYLKECISAWIEDHQVSIHIFNKEDIRNAVNQNLKQISI
jgi:hypothetical protein